MVEWGIRGAYYGIARGTQASPGLSGPAYCRRKGCGYKGTAADDAERRCPRPHPTKPSTVCNFKLMSVGVPKRMTFHALRHTTASLLLMAGVPIAMVSRMLRHSSIAVTERIYAHLAPDWLHTQVQRLSFEPRLVSSNSPSPAERAEAKADVKT